MDDNFTYKFKNIFLKINNYSDHFIVPIQPRKTFWLLFFKHKNNKILRQKAAKTQKKIIMRVCFKFQNAEFMVFPSILF